MCVSSIMVYWGGSDDNDAQEFKIIAYLYILNIYIYTYIYYIYIYTWYTIYTTMHNLRKCSKILGVRRTFSETSKTTRPSNICKSTNNKKNTLEQPSPLNPSFKLGENKKLFDSSWKDWRFRCRGLPIVGPRPVFVATLVDVTSVQLLSYLKDFDHTPRFFKRTKPPKIQKSFVQNGFIYSFVWSFLRHTQCVFDKQIHQIQQRYHHHYHRKDNSHRHCDNQQSQQSRACRTMKATCFFSRTLHI